MLNDLHCILTGTTNDAIRVECEAGKVAKRALLSIGGKQLAPYHTAHYSECTTEFRSLLAALQESEVKDIAENWYTRLRPSKPYTASNKWGPYRLEILQNLSALARVSQCRESRLLFRFEYKSS